MILLIIYRSYVNNEDMNITAMKRVVNTFTSVIASYSLEVIEKHLLENLSYIEKVYDLLGNMNITHSVCVRKHPPSSTPVIYIELSLCIV